MSLPITLTEPENRTLQEFFVEIYQNDQVRSLEGPLILSILNKLEAWPIDLVLTGQENLRIQYQFEKFEEMLTPYPYPYSPLTFGQDTHQLVLIQSVMSKLKVAQ